MNCCLDAVEKFVELVERRAESRMLITGKLEGAHYAAMKQVLQELAAVPDAGLAAALSAKLAEIREYRP